VLEMDLIMLGVNKRSYKKHFEDIKFNNHSCVKHMNNVYIFNKGSLYCFDLAKDDMYTLKPLLFTPEPVKCVNLIITDGYLYMIGAMKYYDDCFIFKTPLENLQLMGDKQVSYDTLLNNKDHSDMILVLNWDDRNKEIFLNKKVMYNFSFQLKNILISYSQNSNYFYFNDCSFIGVYNTLKFIYSDFNDNINAYDLEIISEMIDIIIKYRSKSLLLIVLARLSITNENAIILYELALKHNLDDLKERAFGFISENLGLMFKKEKYVSESPELKKILYENYFCTHSITIQANCLGFDVKSIASSTLNAEKILEMKELCQDNKLVFCLNCKKII
jgi:hypothetical protein